MLTELSEEEEDISEDEAEVYEDEEVEEECRPERMLLCIYHSRTRSVARMNRESSRGRSGVDVRTERSTALTSTNQLI